MSRSLAGATVAPIQVLPGLTATKIVRLAPPRSRTVHCSRKIAPWPTVTSVAVPQPHGGTVTTMRAPDGTVSTGRGEGSVRVIAACPGRAGHDRPAGEGRLSGCAGAVWPVREQPAAETAAMAS